MKSILSIIERLEQAPETSNTKIYNEAKTLSAEPGTPEQINKTLVTISQLRTMDHASLQEIKDQEKIYETTNFSRGKL